MSAILSSDDLNDFISPGVACIKPIETLPQVESTNAYEVTTEDKVAAANAPPATISLTDCLACSGCVTSAEAVLVSLQSHAEVLNTLDSFRSWQIPSSSQKSPLNGLNETNGVHTTVDAIGMDDASDNSKIFVASVSPQVRASLAAVYGITERQAGSLIEQLLGGPHGLKTGGTHGSHFSWIFDTNTVREAALVLAADEVQASLAQAAEGGPKRPILTSACPGWICYAEKTHPYVLPHLSRLKSPQALAGTLVKSVLSKKYNIHPSRIWHLAIMPCFDKKLEASRTELTSASWASSSTSTSATTDDTPVRDVDCVITARELISLATARNITLPLLPLTPFPQPLFPDPKIHNFLFPTHHQSSQSHLSGTSGGYLHHILSTLSQATPNTHITSTRGRNADVTEYALVDSATGHEQIRMARYYGFRNIQNLVRRLKPKRASRMPGAAARKMGKDTGGEAKEEFAYVEVMACPGGCTNGGGQIRVGEVEEVRRAHTERESDDGGDEVRARASEYGVKEQKEWLARVDEAYFSAESSDEDSEHIHPHPHPHRNPTLHNHPSQPHDSAQDSADEMDIDPSPDLIVNGINHPQIHALLNHWSQVTGVELSKLVFTTYREIESDVGKSKSSKKVSDVERVAGLASAAGGGW